MLDDWFELAPCGLLRTADDGTILRVNRTFCSWVGRSVEELVDRRRFQDLLTMGGRIFHQTHWSPLLRMQGSVSEVKLEILHTDGSKLPMVVNSVRREIDGVMRHEIAAFVARDRDRYEQELIKSRRRLEELHAQAKDRALFAEQMIGIVSHDLRNPLSAITMGTGLLEQAVVDPSLRVVHHRIKKATARAVELINELLDFTAARIGRGIAITPAAFDLHAAVADTLEELRLVHPRHALVHVREREGACVADEPRVAQVVGNLVSNAVVYGDREREIRVITRGGSRPTVSVQNWGAPIPPEKLAQLFEPMTRGSESGGRARSIGLGLYIVREIARAHGGAAEVAATADGNITFTVSFAPSSTA